MKCYLFIVCAACSVLGFADTPPQPYPTADAMKMEAFAPENDGTGWALSQNGELFYIVGTTFHKVPGQYRAAWHPYQEFLGDASRGYYIHCMGNWKSTKYLWRLSDGQARLHTKSLAVESNSKEELGNTYVALDGRVLSWNTSRVALWKNDMWSELPALIAHDGEKPIFLEHDGNIIIVCGVVFHVIDADGKLFTQHPGWKEPTFSCVQWNGPVAIRTARGLFAPEAFDMISGQSLPLPQPFSEVQEPVTGLKLSMNGTVWTKTGRALYRLSPEGALRIPLPSEGNMDIVAITDNMDRAAPLAQECGWDIFFKDEQPGLSHWNASGVERLETRHEVMNQTIRNFAYSDDRTFWFVSGGSEARIYRVPLDDTPLEEHEEPKDRWQSFNMRPGTGLMEMGGSIAFFTESGLTLKRWDGNAFTEQSLPQQLTNGIPEGIAWDNQGYVYLRHVYSTAPLDSLTEIGPTTVKVVSDAFTLDQQGKLASALVRAVNRGATGFNWPEGEVILTPEKKIWQLDRNGESVLYYDGVAWRRVRCERAVVSLAYSPSEGIVLRTRDNRTFVYVAGLFEERAGIACVTPPPEPRAQMGALDGTPLADRDIAARYVDRKGNLWFWLNRESKAVYCRTEDLRVTARGVGNPRSPDQLAIRAALEPAFKNVCYEFRLNETEAWQPLQTPEGLPVSLRFPHSGTYTCEVARVMAAA